MNSILTTVYESGQLPIAVALILLVTLAISVVVHLVLRARRRHLGPKSERAWPGAVLDALNAPLQCMIWLIGLSTVVARITVGGDLPFLARVFPPARDVAVIVVVAWFLIRVVSRATRTLAARGGGTARALDATAADAINKMAIAAVLIAALLVSVQTLGFSVTSLLTFGGVAGIAVGFAAQGLVANLLGGVTIYASQPFGVGDDVILPGTNVQGTVKEIGWRATQILGWNGKPYYVPNAKFNTEIITNHSRLLFREISETICLRLEDLPLVPAIIERGNAMLDQHPELQHANKYYVFRLDGFSDHAVKLTLYAYAKSRSYAPYMAGKQDVLLKIAAIIQAEGAHLALPVNVLYAPDGLRRASGHAVGTAPQAAA